MNNDTTKMTCYPEMSGFARIYQNGTVIIPLEARLSTKDAENIVRCCNICDLSDVELDGIQAQGGLKAVLNKLTGELLALNAVAEAAAAVACNPAKEKYLITLDNALAALAKLRNESK